MEERLSRFEERMGEGKRKEAENYEWSEWESWSEGSSDSFKNGEKDMKKRRLKSEVRKASPQRRARSRDRARGSGDVGERHKGKVLMIRKGKKWEEIGLEEWINAEMGEEMVETVERTKDPHVYNVWCGSKDAKRWYGRQERNGKRRR